MEIEGPLNIEQFFPKKELEELEALLNEPISDEPIKLYQQISIYSSWQGRCNFLLAEAESLLAFAENAALMQQTQKETDLIKKVRMKNTVKNERRLRDILFGFSKSLREKLIACQSLRKCLYGEPSGGYQG